MNTKNTAMYLAATTILLSALAPQAMPSTHSSKLVTAIQPPNIDADCLYFQLAGVTQADAIAPNSPWFAIPRAQNGFKEMYALLLTARVSQIAISVNTTGQVAASPCAAYAAVQYIYIPPE
jgi:hypothetical protein